MKIKVTMTQTFRFFLAICCMMSLSAFAKDIKKQPMKTPTFKLNLKVEKYQMANGLRVLLHSDPKAPLINYQTWYRVGGKDDPQGQTGIAHLFEHLMFRETKKRKGKDFLQDIQSRGIYLNAYTSHDHTVYYFNLPKKELEYIAELEAERMVDLVLNETNLKLEQDIVKEERMMRYENSPQNIYIDLFETVFKTSNYRSPVIGYKKDIDAINIKKCLDFYNTFYSPNNAVLVIAGPIHIEKTKKILKKYYGQLKPAKLPNRSYPEEAKQTKTRSKDLHRPVQTASFTLAYPLPKAGSKESYALELLSFILGGGESSRLYRNLVEQNAIAVSAHASAYFLETEGLFYISSDLHPQKSIKTAEQLALKEVQNIISQPITQEELDLAKTNIVKAHVDSLKTAEGKASLLAYHETVFYDYTHSFQEVDRYNNVQLTDIKKVAQTYLNSHQQNFIRLYPKK